VDPFWAGVLSCLGFEFAVVLVIAGAAWATCETSPDKQNVGLDVHPDTQNEMDEIAQQHQEYSNR
jgi:hypothetical protein